MNRPAVHPRFLSAVHGGNRDDRVRHDFLLSLVKQQLEEAARSAKALQGLERILHAARAANSKLTVLDDVDLLLHLGRKQLFDGSIDRTLRVLAVSAYLRGDVMLAYKAGLHVLALAPLADIRNALRRSISQKGGLGKRHDKTRATREFAVDLYNEGNYGSPTEFARKCDAQIRAFAERKGFRMEPGNSQRTIREWISKSKREAPRDT